jgi:tetratricopeptide (TPR) repeat protein
MTGFLLDRVHRDPEDFVAQNMLAGHLLHKMRETGNPDYLDGARRAAESSLASVPAVRNPGGLANLARSEIAVHDFVNARQHALQLKSVDPETAGTYAVLFDAMVELGDYPAATNAVQQMRRLAENTTETEVRFSRMLFLQGDSDGAWIHMFRALAFARNSQVRESEPLAWCEWQAGELEFSRGNYSEAERHQLAALDVFPGYPQALASLGRVRAARHDLTGAIARYEEAVRRLPDPTFVAALGDLYHLANRENDAESQYALVEHIGRLNARNGALYNRQLIIFRADHDRTPQATYESAVKEYAVRHDIYSADALAWAALKAGKIPEAQRASQEATRLGTQDARLLYHAGMIARAAGDPQSARAHLKRALDLCPAFDPLQARVARKALEN